MLDFHEGTRGKSYGAVLFHRVGIFSWTRVGRDFRDAELKTPVMCHVKNTST